MGAADDAVRAKRTFACLLVVEHGVPPTAAEAVARVAPGIGGEAARAAYRGLGARHGVQPEPGGEAIRMAKPFSGAPTPFRVRAGGRAHRANCALDALGVPAVLGAGPEIEAEFAEEGAPARLAVRGGRLRGDGEVGSTC